MRQKVIRSLLNCSYDLDEIKRNGIISAEFRDTAKYTLLYGVQYMLHLKGDAGLCEEAIKNYAVDLELVFVKLWLSNETASENLLWIQKQNIFQELSEDTKGLLNALMFLSRKYMLYSTLRNHPHLFFQTVLNEGGTALSPLALSLLETK